MNLPCEANTTRKTTKYAKPFVKWAGGKRQLIPDLFNSLPDNIERYFEPFVGAGALFFELANNNVISGRKSIIVDLNDDLINAYKVIKNSVESLINELKKHEKNNNEIYYYKVRGLWTRKARELGLSRKELWSVNELNNIQKAARFIYLNKTCYNGLYRLNNKGQFNVPYGNYKNPRICDEDNLRTVSQLLQNVTIIKNDFEIIKDKYRFTPADFVYFDPPYVPLSDTSNFTSYTKNGFTKEDQERLYELFNYIDMQGGKCMLSNSNSPLIKKLYSKFNIKEVKAIRAINCIGNKRGAIKELIITNY
ncbi:DNA adenine methylase [Halothermothrix orenii]|uniref:Site-specific DNA-methyltransferase (adenine-specific) n=1 Tax=Halothermothrix orenii (strain H 168 / OCM 544 / DSM 9562) TaxID=373903 RepID=B8D1X4_HALOH|nr:DNA adenine methylase [Halothermothrix orenii]ACL69201.1 DNA adenine methylase [Halothermothrix orenii H 168]